MSRLAAKPIVIDKAVTIKIEETVINVKGPKGELDVVIHPEVELKLEDANLHVNKKNENSGKFQGLTWSLINNAVIGVTKGYTKELQIVGKGWRSTVKGDTIDLQVGYSHPVLFKLPKGVTATQDNPGQFKLSSHDKQLLGQVCANIRKIRPVEPYKLKGIRIVGEYLRQKVRKAGAV